MEAELKCPLCKHIFVNPVILPCFHSVCLKCAVQLHQPTSGQEDDFDQLSLVSETDSGVVCSPLPSGNSVAITCPVCHKSCLFDENGAGNLCKNRALANIIDRYTESSKLDIECQMCEESPQLAALFCEQCEVFYCDPCLSSLHPSRGPLANHQLISAIQGRSQQRAKFKISAVKEMNCLDHEDNSFSMFCLKCKIPLCVMCLHDGRHATHDVQALGQMSRLQKTQLSQSLQSLSERAKGAHELINNLKGMSAKINANCQSLEYSIRSQCAALIEAVERRRDELISIAQTDKDNRLQEIRAKVGKCSQSLQNTTSLLQLCIESLKETEPTVFLQIGGILINRVKGCEQEWLKEQRQTMAMNTFDFEIDDQAALDEIRQLDFIKNKPPGAPIIILDECGAMNNSITISWRAAINQSPVEAFVLEITDHDGGSQSFREVYCGPDNICTIDGLHFSTHYNVRVKAFNSHGSSMYSKIVSLETHSVACFVLDDSTAHSDAIISEDCLRVTADAFEHRLVLGNLGFSSGVHYWEVTLTRYESITSDVVCGVARYHAARDLMLGKDENSYCMYIDHQRSWYLHNNLHHTRTPLGIRQGDVIGVLLDMDSGTVSFFLNGTLQGGVQAFRNLEGVLYPALNVNRFVEFSLRTGLDPPDC